MIKNNSKPKSKIKGSKSVLQTPCTVSQLARWLTSRFSEIEELFRLQVKYFEEKMAENGESSATHQVGGMQMWQTLLEQAGPILECWLKEQDLIARFKSDSQRDLTRALLLSGNGARFDPAVRETIRIYCYLREEVFRYQKLVKLPQSLRDDIEAGYSRILIHFEEDLDLLGVKLEEVPKGTRLQPTRHRVAKHLSTDDPKYLNRVRYGVTPYFSWKDGNGIDCFEPAQVRAFTQLASSEPLDQPPETVAKPESSLAEPADESNGSSSF